MRLRVFSARRAAAPSLDGAMTLPDAGGDRGGSRNGSKEDSFFEARPWLDSDSEDDFYSVRGDFTPSRGGTPDRYGYRQTPLGPADGPKPPPPPPVVDKKRRLIELLREKQQYDDDEDDGASDVSSGHVENNGSVHPEEHLQEPGRNGGKEVEEKKASKSGCFPNFIWKHGFKMCRNVEKGKKRR